MKSFGDAGQARSSSQILSHLSNIVADSESTLTERLVILGWAGNRASRFRADSQASSQELQRLACLLRSASANFDRHADWIEQREAEMRRLEYRVRTWAVEHPAGAAVLNPTEPDAACIGWFPPTLDPEWENLAARLRRLGASF